MDFLDRGVPTGMTDAGTLALRQGVAQANLPTLILVLFQLTGDSKWLRAPYAPRKGRGLDDNDSGGLSEAVREEIATAASAAIERWLEGAPVAIPRPDDELLAYMLSVSMAEEVPHEYGEIIAADFGMTSHRVGDIPEIPPGFHVAIIGAGVSGICAAIKLRELAISCEIIEKNTDFGGTWHENRYPGAGVDTPNHLYSFSFAPHDWSRYFALQGELRDYFVGVANRYRLGEITRFGVGVERAVWDGAANKWRLTTRGPEGSAETSADAVISAVGVLNNPLLPKIKGLDNFAGPAFHTARWPEGLDVVGKRVAIVGNGASAMQVAPAIAGAVEHLTIFARSKQWAAPFPQFKKAVPSVVRTLLREVPLYRDWYRQRLAWTFNDRIHASLQKDPTWPHPRRSINAVNDGHRRFFTDYIIQELGDRRDLLEKVLPDYPPYGKRMLLDNGWYRTVARDNVTLITEHLAEVRGRTLVGGDGQESEAEVLILATGFRATEFLASYEVVGQGGRILREFWQGDDARAYLGAAIPGFPNFFTLAGPNVGLGHGGSVIKAVELQVDYVIDLLAQMFERGAAGVAVSEGAYEQYNRRVDEAHGRMVWTHSGTENWYRNSRGRVVAITPWRNDDFWRMTRAAKPEDFVFEALRGIGEPADPASVKATAR